MMNTSRAAAYLRQIDPVLGRLIERVGPIKLKPRRLAPFQSLAQAVIYQQLSNKAATTILNRFKALFPNTDFPSPERLLATDASTLRTAGVSRQKAGYLQDLGDKALRQVVPTLAECDRLADEELIERCTAVKGVGRWTAEMLLIFNLGRPDVLPVDDLGVRRGYQIVYGKRALPEPKRLALIGQQWQPYRTTAALYLWRAVDGAAD